MSKTRTERDTMGELQVPVDALWGAQTQRAVNNFPISGIPVPKALIRALGLIKSAAASVNHDLGLLDKDISDAIVVAAGKVSANEVDADFPIDIFQTGSGTSSNMNANEVIAHLATQPDVDVHPNDHVNMGQSSNDVIPTSIHVSACLETSESLLPALRHLQQVLDNKADDLKDVAKTGRTHLMDAMPVTFGQELACWSQ
ncbi:MAG: aspartate ammonia-lyase, partial [Xanthomonadales bacterium]|nr:aspartate ammonia-lyase [Xanthomonadales bacterium]